jgi:hypothetical protein
LNGEPLLGQVSSTAPVKLNRLKDAQSLVQQHHKSAFVQAGAPRPKKLSIFPVCSSPQNSGVHHGVTTRG